MSRGCWLKARLANKVTRAERLLDKIGARTGLSPQGKDFLIAALDPMHDKPLQDLAGWPDVESSASIVRCVKQSKQISSNGSVNWGFVVFTIPALGLSNSLHDILAPSKGASGYCEDYLWGNRLSPNAPAGSQTMGHILIAKFNATATDFRPADTFGDWEVMDLDPIFLSDPMRMLGSGIEITNTTAELYKQGTVSVARVPQGRSAPRNFQKKVDLSPVLTGPVDVSFNLNPVELWPHSLEDLMLLAGSRQWRAADGAYVVEAFVGQENSPVIAEPQGIISPDNTYLTNDPWKYDTRVIVPQYNWDTTWQTVVPGTAPVMVPVHSACILVTGLSPQSTFTLNWNCFIESFPDSGDPSVAVLAKPSCQYDPVALHLLSEGLGTMPVGCPATDNPAGEWFAGLIASIADAIAVPLAAIPEIGLPLSFAAKAAGGFANHYLASNSADTKPRLNQQNNKKKKKKQTPPQAKGGSNPNGKGQAQRRK